MICCLEIFWKPDYRIHHATYFSPEIAVKTLRSADMGLSWDYLFQGSTIALSFQSLLWALLGSRIGARVGVLPSIGPSSGIAIMLPLTALLPPLYESI